MYEYKVVRGPAVVEAHLNQWAQEGWDLVAVIVLEYVGTPNWLEAKSVQMTLRRPLPGQQSPRLKE